MWSNKPCNLPNLVVSNFSHKMRQINRVYFPIANQDLSQRHFLTNNTLVLCQVTSSPHHLIGHVSLRLWTTLGPTVGFLIIMLPTCGTRCHPCPQSNTKNVLHFHFCKLWYLRRQRHQNLEHHDVCKTWVIKGENCKISNKFRDKSQTIVTPLD